MRYLFYLLRFYNTSPGTSQAIPASSLRRFLSNRKYILIIFGIENTKWRRGTFFNTFKQANSPNWTTLFAWHEEQKCRRLQEKASKYSCLQSWHLNLANPLCRIPQSRYWYITLDITGLKYPNFSWYFASYDLSNVS